MSGTRRVPFASSGLTDNDLTDLENAESHAVSHQPVPVHSSIPGQPESPKALQSVRMVRQNTMMQLELYESLENNNDLLTRGPSGELWNVWKQLDTVRTLPRAHVLNILTT